MIGQKALESSMSNSPFLPIAAYQTAADEALLKLCGVSYSEMVRISPALDTDSRMLAAAYDRSLSPDLFAVAFQKAHGLASALDVATGAVMQNRYRAALSAFCTENAEWDLASDGTAYRTVEGATVRLDVDASNASGGFCVSVGKAGPSTSGVKDALQRITAPNVPFEVVGGAIDIEETLSLVNENVLAITSEDMSDSFRRSAH